MSILKSSRDVSRRIFDDHADFYNSSRIINSITGRWDEAILDMPLTEPIIDLGCATGRLLRRLIDKGYGELYGFDLSRSCLSLAKQDSTEGDINIIQGFLERLPFKSSAFSTVILSGVFHHLEKPSAVLMEIVRIMKKPGLFILCDPYFPGGLRQVINQVLNIYPVFGDRRFYTSQQVESIAEKEGLRKKDLFKTSFSYILTFQRC